MIIGTPLKRWVQEATKRYIDSLPDEKIIQLGNKVLGAKGLTDQVFQRMVNAVQGDIEIRIYFAGGDTATISNRHETTQKGPGW